MKKACIFRALLFPLAAAALYLPVAAQATDELDIDIALALGVSKGSVQSLSLPTRLGESFMTAIVLDGERHVLELTPASVRAEGFRLLEQRADGLLYDVDPGPEASMRGRLVDEEGSAAAGGLTEEGLFARIVRADGKEYWVQPLWKLVASAGPADHVIYCQCDGGLFDLGYTCGSDHLPENQGWVAESGSGDQQIAGGPQIAQLGCDADFQYYQKYGSSTVNVSNRIQSVIGTMNQQYQNEVGISHTITTIIVRTSSSQPYTSTDPGTLLNQFRSEWLANQTGVTRDVAHLFTNKNLDGSVIGIAWLGVICNQNNHYGLVQSDFNNNFACATDLSAHEIGHNWNANHCTCPSSTMNPSITCANTFDPTFSRPPIIAHRNSRNCLTDGGGPTTLFSDGFESGDYLAGAWTQFNGNAVVVAAAARTGAFGARLKRTTNITRSISTVGYSSVQLKYSRRTTNLDAGELLYVEYWTGSAWVVVETTSSTAWADKVFTLGSSAANKASFKIRFRTNGNLGDERGDVDNVEVIGTP